MGMIAALDVGGTSIKSGVVDADHESRGADAVALGATIPTRATEGADVVLGQLAAAINGAVEQATTAVAGVALAFPGPFDVARGRALIRGLHKFDSIYGLELRPLLADRISRPDLRIGFARDSEAAGVGEATFGSGRGGGRVLTITLGTGLGSCLTAGGAVIETVGELEIEMLAQRSTPHGRADDVLSARGLADRLGIATADLRSVIDEDRAVSIVIDHGRRLGDFLAPVVDELTIDLVVVGGGLVAAFDRFGPALREALGSIPCVPAELGAAGPLLGAVRLAFPPA
jgi:glucokinase